MYCPALGTISYRENNLMSKTKHNRNGDFSRRSLDSLGGGNIIRQLDSLGGGNILRSIFNKYQYNDPKRGGHPILNRKNKKFKNLKYINKKIFDEIDRSGFGRLIKNYF